MAEEQKSNFNWALILNAGMLLLVIIGAWFTTFSSPLNDKFSTLDKSLSTQQQIQSQRIEGLRTEMLSQLEAQNKANALALDTVKAINNEIEKSIERRFRAQDDANDKMQKQLDSRFGYMQREHDHLRQDYHDLLADIEKRRAEIATRTDQLDTKPEQNIVIIDTIKTVCGCGVYCQDIGDGRCRYQQVKDGRDACPDHSR